MTIVIKRYDEALDLAATNRRRGRASAADRERIVTAAKTLLAR